jgi:hypothetical protein
VDHLLAGCVFSHEFWFRLLRCLGWRQLTPESDDKIIAWWLDSRKRVAKPRRKAFDSLVLLGMWSLWLERNARTFAGGSDTVDKVTLKAGQQR